jgi:rhamnosyltransferase
MDRKADMQARQANDPTAMSDWVKRVGGIVVTYHPDADVVHNLAELRSQVGQLIVVDNGSNASAVAMLKEASTEIGFDLVANRENLGIAAGLNIGIHRAIELGCAWLLLFDQDSCISDTFTRIMLATYATLAATRLLGILVPLYIDSRTGQPLPFARHNDGTLPTAMTSGSLIAVSTFRACGPFADELFIDSVDHEYSLRLRKAGFVIAVCERAQLLHSPGTPRPHALLGINFQSTNYSPLRRFYQERNKLWLYRRYALRFPGFCGREFVRSFVDLTKILLVESDKQRKCRFFFRGIYAGLRGRMGKLRSPSPRS